MVSYNVVALPVHLIIMRGHAIVTCNNYNYYTFYYSHFIITMWVLFKIEWVHIHEY
jgi:hypothetical protein